VKGGECELGEGEGQLGQSAGQFLRSLEIVQVTCDLTRIQMVRGGLLGSNRRLLEWE
jgi:hypothetical protein